MRAARGKRNPRYARKPKSDFDTKEPENVYDSLKIGNKPMPSEGSSSPVFRKRQGIFNSYLKSKKLADQQPKIEPPIKPGPKRNVLHQDGGKKTDTQRVNGNIGDSILNRPKSEVKGRDSSPASPKEIEIIPKPDSKYRIFTLSTTSPAIKMDSEKPPKIPYLSQDTPNSKFNKSFVDYSLPPQNTPNSKIKLVMDPSLPPQTVLVSKSNKAFVDLSLPSKIFATVRPHKSYIDFVQFRKHVEVLKQQQCWLVDRILNLKEELNYIIFKMERLRSVNLKHRSKEKIQEFPENIHLGEKCHKYDSNNVFAKHDTVESFINSDLPYTTQSSDDKFSIGDNSHSEDKICYDKCWNAKSSADDAGTNEQQARLDRLLLSEDITPAEVSVSFLGDPKGHSKSRGTYCQLQYIFLAALMLLQFTIQFVAKLFSS